MWFPALCFWNEERFLLAGGVPAIAVAPLQSFAGATSPRRKSKISRGAAGAPLAQGDKPNGLSVRPRAELPTAQIKDLRRGTGGRRCVGGVPAQRNTIIQASWLNNRISDIADFAPRLSLRSVAGFGPAQPMSRGLSPPVGRALMNPLPSPRRSASLCGSATEIVSLAF